MQDEAKTEYASIIASLAASEKPAGEDSSSTEANQSKYQCLNVTQEGSVTKIVLNRPSKKNALTREVSIFSLTIVFSFLISQTNDIF